MMYFFEKNKRQNGGIIVMEVVLIFIVSLAVLGVLALATQNLKTLRSSVAREKALHIAEAGIEYYKWHLAHFPTDYANGTGVSCDPCGPYVVNYTDPISGLDVGKYSLTITPPSPGQGAVLLESTGWLNTQPNIKRTVTVLYGQPGITKYEFLTQYDSWIDSTQNVDGRMHTNGGIRFDGIANAPITSGKDVYECGADYGCQTPATKQGIWGSAGIPSQGFWSYPEINISFLGATSKLAALKSEAQISGIYLPPSTKQGYSLVFQSDGTVDVYEVNSLNGHDTGYDVLGSAHIEDLDYNARSLLFTADVPKSGAIFAEDNVWVEGIVVGMVTVGVGTFPYFKFTAPDIIIPDDLTLFDTSGQHVLGLMAQQNILVGYGVPADLAIQAAMFAQYGSVQRYNFVGNLKSSLSVFGSVASFGPWAWNWLNDSGQVVSGFSSISVNYDSNLYFNPPPFFPYAPESFEQLDWNSN